MFIWKKDCLTHSECFQLALEEAQKDNPNKILIRKLFLLGKKYISKYIDTRSTEYRYPDGTRTIKRPDPDDEAEMFITGMRISVLLGKDWYV